MGLETGPFSQGEFPEQPDTSSVLERLGYNADGTEPMQTEIATESSTGDEQLLN